MTGSLGSADRTVGTGFQENPLHQRKAEAASWFVVIRCRSRRRALIIDQFRMSRYGVILLCRVHDAKLSARPDAAPSRLRQHRYASIVRVWAIVSLSG
jgi:hypothetical protein